MLAGAAYVTAQFWPDAQPEFPSQRLRPCDKALFVKKVNTAAKRVGLTDAVVLKFREEAIAWRHTEKTDRKRLSLVRWLDDCQSPITLETALSSFEQYADPRATWAIKAFLLRWRSFTNMRAQDIPNIRPVALAPSEDVARAVSDAARLRFSSTTRGLIFGYESVDEVEKGKRLCWDSELHNAYAQELSGDGGDWYSAAVRFTQMIALHGGDTLPNLTPYQIDALKALLDLKAFTTSERKNASAIMKQCGLRARDCSKRALAELVARGYLASTTYRGGGYWLTAEGAMIALRSQQ